MRYGYTYQGNCVNVIEAEQGFAEGYLPFSGMDAICLCPEGFGIGDRYEEGEWVKVEQPVPESLLPMPGTTLEELKEGLLIVMDGQATIFEMLLEMEGLA